jgi:hypothetical protein
VIAITGRSYRLCHRAEGDDTPGKQQEGLRTSVNSAEPSTAGRGEFSSPNDTRAHPPASSEGGSDDTAKGPPNPNGKPGRRKNQ